jgi:hypothetical protein
LLKLRLIAAANPHTKRPQFSDRTPAGHCSRRIVQLTSSRSVRSQVVGLIAWLAVVFAVAAAGAIASIEANSFYGCSSASSPPMRFGPGYFFAWHQRLEACRQPG